MTEVEQRALIRLERSVRRMLWFTWEDDCDEDAAKLVKNTREAILDLDAARRLSEPQDKP